MKKRKVVILDDGVSPDYIDKKTSVKVYHYIATDKEIIPYSGVNNLSHGTLCSAILVEYFNNCFVYDINVFYDGKNSVLNNVINGLKWCQTQKIDLICMSIGTFSKLGYEKLLPVVKSITEKGTTIIAACSNSNKVTFPASFSNVIGVKYKKEIESNEIVCCNNPIDGIQVLSGFPKDCKCVKELIVNFSYDDITNSMVVPYVASIFLKYNCIENDIFCKSQNKENSIGVINLHDEYQKFILDKISNPIILLLDLDPVEIESIKKVMNEAGYWVLEIGESDSIENMQTDAKRYYLVEDVEEYFKIIEYIFYPDIVFITTSEMNSNQLSKVVDLIIYRGKDISLSYKSIPKINMENTSYEDMLIELKNYFC